MHHRRTLAAVVSAVSLLALSSAADAQSLGDRLKKRAEEAAKRTVEQRVDQKTTQATNAALDKAENAVKCATSDTACQEKATAEGKTVVIDDSAPKGGVPVAEAAAEETAGVVFRSLSSSSSHWAVWMFISSVREALDASVMWSLPAVSL